MLVGLFTVRSKKCRATFDSLSAARAALELHNLEREATKRRNLARQIAYSARWNAARNAGDKALLQRIEANKPRVERVPGEMFLYGIESVEQ